MLNIHSEWKHGGYIEIQKSPKRYRIIDVPSLMSLMNINSIEAFQKQHRRWVEEEIASDKVVRDKVWTESLAVGNEAFVNQVQQSFGNRKEHRDVKAMVGKHVLREI